MSDVGICVHAVSHSISRYRNFVALEPFLWIWPKRIHYIHFNFIRSIIWMFGAFSISCFKPSFWLAGIHGASIPLADSATKQVTIGIPLSDVRNKFEAFDNCMHHCLHYLLALLVPLLAFDCLHYCLISWCSQQCSVILKMFDIQRSLTFLGKRSKSDFG